jgi:16S rRNA (uracil1498-N3)-methyltransferase
MSQTTQPHGGHGSEGHGAWLFADAIPAEGATHWLARDEARHATGSRRLRPGDPLILFDGCGTVAEAVLGHARRDDGALEVRVGSVRSEPRQGRHVTVASAVPKGDRLATLMEGIGPLGVARFVPIRAERSVVPWSDHLAQRCRRILVECAKQSHSPWIASLPAHGAPAEGVAGVVMASTSPGRRVVLADRAGEPLRDVARAVDAAHEVVVLIGPEGGFSERERGAAIAAGAVPVSLGPSILRIELAATVAASLLRLE